MCGPPLPPPRAGLKEANDIVLYLMPLRILLEEMEQADFTMVQQQGKGRAAGLVPRLGEQGCGPREAAALGLGVTS